MSNPLLLRFPKARLLSTPAASLRRPAPSTILSRPQQRHTSSANRSKPIILEQPDKFRPPSHPSRLVKGRSRGSTYNGAYNQSSTDAERTAQRTRKYPHMFPDKGTLAHRVLTNRGGHVLLTVGVLILLSVVTWMQTFVKTSPFGHLMPSLSSFWWNPIGFFQDAASVLRLHQDYITEKVEFDRACNILDAQKRRIYRRAHGMEDLNRDEDQGVDVRGIVPWDDGLTNRERAAGGIGANRIKMIQAVKYDDRDKANAERTHMDRYAKAEMASVNDEVFIRRREAELGLSKEEDSAAAAYNVGKEEAKIAEQEMSAPATGTGEQQQDTVRRRKLWFGIW